jgi:hypothetical protein
MSGMENTEKSVSAESVSRTIRDDTDNVFVVGDVHGHLDRLEALLRQEGLLGRCDRCKGAGLVGHHGDIPEAPDPPEIEWTEVDCPDCDGEGWERKRKDVMVIQLGDLGHFGTRGSMTGDEMCYRYVTVNRWCDVVLWGNHDRASIDGAHHATDFIQVPTARHYISQLFEEGRMRMAFYAHGFVITHAGLASAFAHQGVREELKADPVAFVDWINDQDERWIEGMGDENFDPKSVDKNALAIINAIGARRGGRVPTGGLLWRDINEGLYDGFRQIFGHSADGEKHAARYCRKGIHTRHPEQYPHTDDWNAWSYCIDIGGKGERPGDACLMGIWLPSEKIVRVDL